MKSRLARTTGLFVASFVVAVSLSTTVTADILSVDDPTFGVGALTRDTDQGLDFLDLTFSVDRTFDDVSTQFGSGGDYEGFRFATEMEVINLINNYGFLPVASPGVTVTGDGTGASLVDLVSLLSPTYFDSNSNFHGVAGFTATDGDFVDGKRVISIRGEFTTPFDEVVSDLSFHRTFAQGPDTGSFLVRSTVVPEPGSFALFVGLIGFGFLVRRRS